MPLPGTNSFPFFDYINVEDASAPGQLSAEQLEQREQAFVTYVDAQVAAAVARIPSGLSIMSLNRLGALAAGAGAARLYLPYRFIITGVKPTLTGAASTSGAVTVDLNADGVSIMNPLSMPSIPQGALHGPVVTPSTVDIAADSYLTMDVDSAGVGAEDLLLEVIGRLVL